ncbi:MAG: (2Fe-2S)-binding protein [Candidatus Latescibacterota bacterium]
MAKKSITFSVNGKAVSLAIAPGEMLVDVLRGRLGLTGTKVGCREGECGACSIIMNGRLVTSCLLPAMKADRSTIVTIEGLVENGQMHFIQKRFIEEGAIQCGFCTPAMVLAGKALLDVNPHPTWEEIKLAISGIICRCTGYQKIIKAIDSASYAGELR